MNLQMFLLIVVVVTALAFDVTNGFHDTGNAIVSTTQIVTGPVLGSGVGKPGADVRWGVARRTAIAGPGSAREGGCRTGALSGSTR